MSNARKIVVHFPRAFVLIWHKAKGARVSLRQLLLVDNDEATSVAEPVERFLNRRLL